MNPCWTALENREERNSKEKRGSGVSLAGPDPPTMLFSSLRGVKFWFDGLRRIQGIFGEKGKEE